MIFSKTALSNASFTLSKSYQRKYDTKCNNTFIEGLKFPGLKFPSKLIVLHTLVSEEAKAFCLRILVGTYPSIASTRTNTNYHKDQKQAIIVMICHLRFKTHSSRLKASQSDETNRLRECITVAFYPCEENACVQENFK